MSYFIKKSNPTSKGLYLQIYEGVYDPKTKKMKNHSYEKVGYAIDLLAQGIDDPEAYVRRRISQLNDEEKKRRDEQIGETCPTKNLGYFLIKDLMDDLEVKRIIEIASQSRRGKHSLYDIMTMLISSQVVCPKSKKVAYEEVIPSLLGGVTLGYDEILDNINYIGNDYEKVIEIFTSQVIEKFNLTIETIFFDTTNYFFEIDLPVGDLQLGMSKENKKNPIICQTLMLSKEAIPIYMNMYPGNENEKKELRHAIEEIKDRFDLTSRLVSIADKGLNCARNIYYLSEEGADGYVFSKSIAGNSLSQREKEWIYLDTQWKCIYDEKKELLLRYKECIDEFDYSFIDDHGERVTFKRREKRVVTYSPSLANKKKNEITQQIEKVQREIKTLKDAKRSEYGLGVKYFTITPINNKGEEVKVNLTFNQKKFDADMKEAGYNLMVTSELEMTSQEIIDIYHQLYLIEDSFHLLKSYLSARPVFVKKQESIYGHFTICFLALLLMRVLEIKIFKHELSCYQLFDFIRHFYVTKQENGRYINNLTERGIANKVKYQLGLNKITSLYLSQKDVNNILKAPIIYDD